MGENLTDNIENMSTEIEAENIARINSMVEKVCELMSSDMQKTPDHMEDLRILAATQICLIAIKEASRSGVIYEMGLIEHIKESHLTFNRETAIRERLDLLNDNGFDQVDNVNPIVS